MHFTGLDWAVMAAFFAASLGIGLSVSRKAGRSFNSFFLGGRTMPWWLLGVSMVATTFSTDTPNLIADIVRTNGTVGNWTWWAFLLSGMLTVFLYAKLWRRSEVSTDVAFYELRYSGKMAAFLRFFRGIYLGLIFNIFIMGTVTLAAIKIGGAIMGWSPLQTILIAATVTIVYSALGGLTGVLLTDLLQFTLAIIGSIGAAWYILSMPEIGGLSGLLSHDGVRDAMNFLPDFAERGWETLIPIFVIPLAVQWWATYYPGAEPGGGGYVVQRMLAARNEKNAVGATLLFNGMHYALRPWPWILVALASIVVFPELSDLEARFPDLPGRVIRDDLAYPAMLTFLPSGLLGVVMTSLAAAYMSTMSTSVNWGSSILVHDVYERFVNPDATESQLVWTGRLATVFLMVVACLLALYLENSFQGFTIILQIGAGTGLLYLLRWFWWRVNATSEICAMVVSFSLAIILHLNDGFAFSDWQQLLILVVVTTVAWVGVAYLTPPADDEVLFAFYRKIQPGGPGWKPILERARAQGLDLHDTGQASDIPIGLLCAVLGSAGIYSLLFGTGYFLYNRPGLGALFTLIAVLTLGGVFVLWQRLTFR